MYNAFLMSYIRLAYSYNVNVTLHKQNEIFTSVIDIAMFKPQDAISYWD